jgi:hypothetical protein
MLYAVVLLRHAPYTPCQGKITMEMGKTEILSSKASGFIIPQSLIPP